MAMNKKNNSHVGIYYCGRNYAPRIIFFIFVTFIVNYMVFIDISVTVCGYIFLQNSRTVTQNS